MAGDFYRLQTQRTSLKCFRCGSIDNLFAKYPKLPKEEKKNERRSVSMKGIIAHRKENPRTETTITIKIYMHL